MTQPTPPYRVPRQPGVARDWAAVACIFLGVAGLVFAAFWFDPRAGFAVASLAFIAVGVYLGTSG